MRKNISLPELNTINFTPEKTMMSGWTTKQSSGYKFNLSKLAGKKFDIANVKVSGSVFPVPARIKAIYRQRKSRRSIRSLKRNIKIPRKANSVDRKNEIQVWHNKAPVQRQITGESDMYLLSDTGRETETPSGKFVGKDAFNHYYKNYKRFSIDPDNCRKSATIAFIKECKEMNIAPVPLGLVKRKGDAKEINVNQSQLGSQYLKALTSSMKHLDPKGVKIQNIKENEVGIIEVVKTLKKS